MVKAHTVLLVLVAVLVLPGCSDSRLEPYPPGWGTPRPFSQHTEIDLGFVGSDGTPLSGTLCLPLGGGPFGAVVFHFGSDRWRTRPCSESVGWRSRGIATFSYDKRGVGRSGGRCCPFAQPGYFELLAGDVRAAAESIAARGDIDETRVGAFGFSQGGWVVPVAMATAPERVRFAVIGSGPAVSLGEELYYSDLTGDSSCRPSGLSDATVDSLLALRGPSLFDPGPYLAQLVHPTLWIYGGLDRSIPVNQSASRLAAIRGANGLPIEVTVIPDMNHVWIVDGGMCQTTGTRWDDSQVIVPFLEQHGLVTSPPSGGSR